MDALRAVMMLLGLVLHSALTYNITDHGQDWPLKDPQSTHVFSDFLVLLIHSFRMPVFFVVAGFFGATLFYERQPRGMLKNRLERIVYPFILFLFLLWPFIMIAFNYSNAVFAGDIHPWENAIEPLSKMSAFVPSTTSHLWFLYYLSMFSGFTAILALVIKRFPNLTNRVKSFFSWVLQRAMVRVMFFSGVVGLTLFCLGTSMVQPSVALVPDLSTFVYFMVFYLMGWMIYVCREHLNRLTDLDWVCTILAIGITVLQGLTVQNSEATLKDASGILILYNSLGVCLFVFGITGLFLRYGSRQSMRMRYISDASYWVYLIHLPVIVFLPSFIADWSVSALVKFLFVLLTTTLLSFMSYHYGVRNTFIGLFLNGRKYPLRDK